MIIILMIVYGLQVDNQEEKNKREVSFWRFGVFGLVGVIRSAVTASLGESKNKY